MALIAAIGVAKSKIQTPLQLLTIVLYNLVLVNPNWNYIKELTIAWYFLQRTGKVCTFVAQRFVTAPLAFNSGFEGVPVI